MKKDKLIELYQESSKHANYQILPTQLLRYIDTKSITVRTRFEKERLTYILNNLDIKGKIILDIGGNSGYFSFELLEAGAKQVYYVEGNSAHAKFVKGAVELLNLSNIYVSEGYYSFISKEDSKKYDIVFLLNVLHHIGDDYGNKKVSKQDAKIEIIGQLNYMANKTQYCVFQLGFNWKGDRDNCLFAHGTKKELVDFITQGIGDYWEIIKIGIPEKINDTIQYYDLNETNMRRNDSLGEFLNRPLFILESKEV